MNCVAITLSLAAAFAAGCSVTHLLRPAIAAENITAQVIHTGELEGDALGTCQRRRYAHNVRRRRRHDHLDPGRQCRPKHMHPNTNEIQYILDGTGTIWLGDKEVTVKPGDLVVIPKGTPHGGTKPDGRTIKAIAIKTPPQAPDDTKMLN